MGDVGWHPSAPPMWMGGTVCRVQLCNCAPARLCPCTSIGARLLRSPTTPAPPTRTHRQGVLGQAVQAHAGGCTCAGGPGRDVRGRQGAANGCSMMAVAAVVPVARRAVVPSRVSGPHTVALCVRCARVMCACGVHGLQARHARDAHSVWARPSRGCWTLPLTPRVLASICICRSGRPRTGTGSSRGMDRRCWASLRCVCFV